MTNYRYADANGEYEVSEEEILAIGGPFPVFPEGDELMSIHARSERDGFLQVSDWTQMPDSQLSAEKKAEWASYRQALRDVPQQAGFPNNITWPTKPA